MPNARPIIRSPVKQPARKAAILVQKVPADQDVGNKPDRPVAPLATAQPISPLITAEHQKLTVGLSLPAALPAVWSVANVPKKTAPAARQPHVPPAAMPMSERKIPVHIPATPGVSPVHTPATILPALLPARPELLPAERTAFRDVNMSSAATQAKDMF